MPKKQTKSYAELKRELDEVMLELEREDIDVEEALMHYERGQQLIGEIESYLKSAQNKVREVKARFNNKKT